MILWYRFSLITIRIWHSVPGLLPQQPKLLTLARVYIRVPFLLLQIIYLHFQMIHEKSRYYANATINIWGGEGPDAIFQISTVHRFV